MEAHPEQLSISSCKTSGLGILDAINNRLADKLEEELQSIELKVETFQAPSKPLNDEQIAFLLHHRDLRVKREYVFTSLQLKLDNEHEVDDVNFGQTLIKELALHVLAIQESRLAITSVEPFDNSTARVDITIGSPSKEELEAYDNRPDKWRRVPKPKNAEQCEEVLKSVVIEELMQKSKYLTDHDVELVRVHLVDPMTAEERKKSQQAILNAMVFMAKSPKKKNGNGALPRPW